MKLSYAGIVVALLGLAGWGGAAYGQAGPPAGGASGAAAGGGGVDRSRGPEGTTDIGKYQNWDELLSQARSGNYLAGRVQIKGGEIPWESIAINVMCDGKEKLTTYADAKGNFLLQPPAAKTARPDNPTASSSKATASSEFFGCQVHAALPGFDSSTVTIASRDLTDNPDIGTITLAREAGAEGSALSATSAAAPKDAVKSFEKARKEWLDGHADKAEKELRKATKAYPQYAEAWYQLGKVQQSSKPQDSWESFSKAVAADPKFVLPYDHLANLAAQAEKWKELEEYTDTALQLNPGESAQILYLNALGKLKMNNRDAAEASAKKALAMDPLHTVPNTEQLLAVILAGKGDYAGALEHLKNCLTYLPSGQNADIVKQQIAQLEKMVPQTKP